MNMSNRRIRRWALLGAVVSGSLLTACERKNAGPNELDSWPKTGVNEREGVVNDAQNVDSFETEQPATGGAGFEQEPVFQGGPGTSTPREDGQGSEVLRDHPAQERNQDV